MVCFSEGKAFLGIVFYVRVVGFFPGYPMVTLTMPLKFNSIFQIETPISNDGFEEGGKFYVRFNLEVDKAREKLLDAEKRG